MAETLKELPDRSNLRGLVDRQIRLSKRYRKTEKIVAMTPGTVPANSATEVDVTVPGTTGQTAQVSGQVQLTGLSIISADFVADNTLRVRFFNSTGAGIVGISGDYRVKVIQ